LSKQVASQQINKKTQLRISGLYNHKQAVGATSGETSEMGNDIPVHDAMKENDMLASVLNELSDKNIQDVDSDKGQE
jgi:hypothetical protein